MTLALLLTHVFNANINVTIKTQYEDVLKFYFQVISLPSVWSSLLLHFSSWYCLINFLLFAWFTSSIFLYCSIPFSSCVTLYDPGQAVHGITWFTSYYPLLITCFTSYHGISIMIINIINPFHHGIAWFTSYYPLLITRFTSYHGITIMIIHITQSFSSWYCSIHCLLSCLISIFQFCQTWLWCFHFWHKQSFGHFSSTSLLDV